jgi:hypothetical protein
LSYVAKNDDEYNSNSFAKASIICDVRSSTQVSGIVSSTARSVQYVIQSQQSPTTLVKSNKVMRSTKLCSFNGLNFAKNGLKAAGTCFGSLRIPKKAMTFENAPTKEEGYSSSVEVYCKKLNA